MFCILEFYLNFWVRCSATSAVPTAMLPAVARGSTLITPPVAASLRQERSEISTPFVEAKTSVADVLAGELHV